MANQENTLQNWTLVDILQNLHKSTGRGMQHWYFYHLWPSWFVFGLSQPKVIWLAKIWIQASTRYKVNQITEDHIPSGVTEKTRKLQYCSYLSSPHRTQIVLFRKASCPQKKKKLPKLLYKLLQPTPTDFKIIESRKEKGYEQFYLC